MKIGILVHSNSGHTYSVAEKLMEKLVLAGHSVEIEKIIPTNDKEIDFEKVLFEVKPDADKYEGIIFGAPVRGMTLSPIMSAYIRGCDNFQGKKVACIITQSFPYPWMGGNRCNKVMVELCKLKGADVIGTGVVNWSKKNRDKVINKLVERIAILF